MTIRPANIQFNPEGVPVAADFDDVYFSKHDGLAETRYVFIENNLLPQRWKTHTERTHTIGETGFGTGLNFLATWSTYEKAMVNNNETLAPLHFISIEKYPLNKQDLRSALAKWPELSRYADELLHQYPHLIAGCHRLTFAQGAVILDLWFGDVIDVFNQFNNQLSGRIDTWFLDGFAPSKNPQMWSQELFNQMARLSRKGATFATFTAAGFVKRGLQSANFDVNKVKGFGRKRDMLIGVFNLPSDPKFRKTETFHYRAAMHNWSDVKPYTKPSIAVVGGGIASANLLLSLAQRQCNITLYCQDDTLAKGASGNPQGGFYPQLNAQANIASRIQALSFDFAKRRYQALLSQGHHFAHSWCGVLLMAFNDAVSQRHQKLIDSRLWPSTLLHPVDADEASKIAGLPLPYNGFFVPDGGWISPPEFVRSCIAAAQRNTQCDIQLNTAVTGENLFKSNEHPHQWCIQSGDQRHIYDAVVFCNGAETDTQTLGADIPFNHVRGQVESIPSQHPLRDLKTVLCHKGYLTPAFNGRHALGSTYVKHDTATDYRVSEENVNRNIHERALPALEWLSHLSFDQHGRAAIRCSLPDHAPVVGALYEEKVQAEQYWDLYKAMPKQHYPIAKDSDGLFVLAGFGSRGLTTAPLMAEVLTAQMLGEALPLDNDLLSALNPNRFLVRRMIRQQPSK